MAIQDECGNTNTTITIRQWANFVSYICILPPYLIIGLSGNVILLVTFYKQSKTEPIYGYQVLLIIGKTFEVLAFGGYHAAGGWLSGVRGPHVDWYTRNFFLMWLNFKMGPPAHMHFVTSAPVIAVAMAADRVFALTLPFRYKNFNHKKNQMISALISFILPSISSISYTFYRDVVQVGDHYESLVNETFTASTFGKVCSRLGVFIRIICIIALISLNVIMAIAFRKRTNAIAKITNIKERNEARRLANKTAFLLNVWQSVLMFINQVPHIIHHTLAFIFQTYPRCRGLIWSPIIDSLIFITDSIDLMVVMAINRKLRRAVLNVMRCKNNQTAPIANTRTRNT